MASIGIATPPITRPGWRERQRHVEAIRSGQRCFIVMVAAQDPAAPQKSIKSFDVRHIVVGDGLVTRDGMDCILVCERVPVADFIKAG